MSFPTSRPNGFRPFGAPAFLHPSLDGPPTIAAEARDQIGEHLRAMYAALTREPVPERFAALIERLGHAGNGTGRNGAQRR
jgi:Anti-sigma factor NepR